MPLFKLDGGIYEHEVQNFYAIRHNVNMENLSFMSEVHGIPIEVNPDILSVELGVQRV